MNCYILITLHCMSLHRSDCEIFTLKYLECLWAGQPFEFEKADSLRLREQVATKIFQNCKSVPIKQ